MFHSRSTEPGDTLVDHLCSFSCLPQDLGFIPTVTCMFLPVPMCWALSEQILSKKSPYLGVLLI